MVREIVHIQVGQCGNQIGTKFWEAMCGEHNINYDGHRTKNNLDKLNVYFSEGQSNRYVARSILVDLEPGTLNTIKSSPLGNLFRPDNFIFGYNSAANNWAKGHYTDGAELIDHVMDCVRRESELCDYPQGYQITHSLGGGTGSGMGTLLLSRLRDTYPDRINASFSVFPSKNVSEVVTEPYNATFAIHQLIENCDETFTIDNEALFNISHNVLKQTKPTYLDLNWLISMVMSGCTSSLRFSGKLNGDLRKMAVNLIPFPRLHFFMVSHAPLFGSGRQYINLNVREITSQMWSTKNYLVNVQPGDGKFLATNVIYRGDVSTKFVDSEITKKQFTMSDEFVPFIPNNIKAVIVNTPPNGTPLSGTFIANTTALKCIFRRLSKQFSRMYRRKAFLHWYFEEGMDQMEFDEANQNIRDLVNEYQDKQDAIVSTESSDDDDDDDDDDVQSGNDYDSEF